MEKLKRKQRPIQPVWEFVTGYSLAECVDRLERFDRLYPVDLNVIGLEPQTDGSYTFTLRYKSHFDTPGAVEEQLDGSTRLYGGYRGNGCTPGILLALIGAVGLTLLFSVPWLSCILITSIGIVLALMLAFYKYDLIEMRRAAAVLEEALSSKPEI